MIACGIAAPITIVRGFKCREGPVAIVAGFAVILGYIGSLPVGNTRELFWLPWLAMVYFGGMTLAAIFYGLGSAAERKA